jgi:hypothetical protein
MSDFFHTLLLWRRAIFLVLLGLLLPAQSSLAYARSLVMLTLPQPEPVMALISVIEAPTVVQQHQHHHSSQHVDAEMDDESFSDYHHVSDTVKPCHSDAPSGKQGHDCAKCCLMGAAAPPPCAVHNQSLLVARRIFVTSSDPLSGFIPDALERPPRTQLA